MGSPDELLKSIVNVVRGSTSLAAQDVDFYKSLDKEVSKNLNKTSGELVSLLNTVLLSIDKNSQVLEAGRDKLDDTWKDFSNVMDNLLERSDRAIDSIKKGPKQSQKEGDIQYLDGVVKSDFTKSATRIEKPQLKFKTPVDNSETHPFKPLLKEKPNALKTLEESLVMIPEEEDVPSHFRQPYEFEIDNQEYNKAILQKSEPIPSKPWDSTDAIWVDDQKSLLDMIDHLKSYTEIAIDLEHHDYRSYYGIVCLMQISTRERDYLVDTLALRDDLWILNSIFTDPEVTKVFHGAFMDIIWLQRDLGLYVVSLFDTYHASRALGLPRHSLAYLLEKFAHFKTSKKYQLADWRLRPLSKPMIAYARADTHFLLNIYDLLKNQLIEQSKLAGVLHESRKVAKRRFEFSKFRPKLGSSEVYSPLENKHPWRTIMYQYNIPADKEDLLRELWEWRDMIARRDDESARFVMPNQLLVSLVAYTPKDPMGVISVSNVVTDYVKSNSKVIANIISKSLTGVPSQATNDMHGAATGSTASAADSISGTQIKDAVALYSDLLASWEVNGTISSPEKRNSESFTITDILATEKKIVKYSGDRVHQLTKEQLDDRSQEIQETAEPMQEAVLTIAMEEANEPFTLDKEEPVAKENNVITTEKEKTEDLDEVIVLREKKVPEKKKKKVQARDSRFIDYSTSKQVLGSDTKKKGNKSSKRKIDPYAIDAEAVPKGAKKRKTKNTGKNISFKR